MDSGHIDAMLGAKGSIRRTKLAYEEYTVGWISALPREQSAVFLDETHEVLPQRNKAPRFTLGRIAGHNVVLAVLPNCGIAATSRCMSQMEGNFPNLRFVLLVGIAGGAPSKKRDIRLGDIVVSRPGKRDMGVLQYDFGTNIQGPEHLNLFSTKIGVPDAMLLGAVDAVEREDMQSEEAYALAKRLVDYTEHIADKYPRLGDSRRPSNDVLFQTEFEHYNPSFPDGGQEEDCEKIECDVAQSVKRPEREPAGLPQIWQGLIGSGDEVMRNAEERDRIANEHGVLCFEMEAAGLSTQTGWLVIRGICDYCDTHKNKKWQSHAALIAAAYAREVLKAIPPLNQERARPSPSRYGGPVNQVQNNYGTVTVNGGNAMFGSNMSGNSNFNFR